jgi:hypothetical protein
VPSAHGLALRGDVLAAVELPAQRVLRGRVLARDRPALPRSLGGRKVPLQRAVKGAKFGVHVLRHARDGGLQHIRSHTINRLRKKSCTIIFQQTRRHLQ